MEGRGYRAGAASLVQDLEDRWRKPIAHRPNNILKSSQWALKRIRLWLQLRSHSGFFTAELQVAQPAVEASSTKQLFVAAALHDAAGVEHHDLVGIAHRRQPMSDDQHGALLHQP